MAMHEAQPVLLIGEPGTGKLDGADVIHRASSRGKRPIVVVECAGTPEAALELELFGHARAPEGARFAESAIRRAHRSTLVLRNLPALPPALARRLSKVVDDGVWRPTGGEYEGADVRIIATSRSVVDARALPGADWIPMTIPPLRHRRGDAVQMVSALITRRCANRIRLDEGAMAELATRSYRVRNADEVWLTVLKAIARRNRVGDPARVRAESLPPREAGRAQAPLPEGGLLGAIGEFGLPEWIEAARLRG
jgi:DNA-binding NtrC family response regulator